MVVLLHNIVHMYIFYGIMINDFIIKENSNYSP